MSNDPANNGTLAERIRDAVKLAERVAATVDVAPVDPGAVGRPQAHGGTLRSGGKPGNAGGGRPKESYRRRMRRLLGKSLELLERDTDAAIDGKLGELAASSVGPDGPKRGLLTRGEVQKTAELAAKYGVGKDDKRVVEQKVTRYVVRLPARVPLAAIARVTDAGPVDLTDCEPGESDTLGQDSAL